MRNWSSTWLVPDLWTPAQLDAVQCRSPIRGVRALVAEIGRLNVIAQCAGDLVRALESARLRTAPKLLLTALVERLETAQSRGPSGPAPGQPRQTQFDPEVILRVLSHR